MKRKQSYKSASDEQLLHAFAENGNTGCMAELWHRYSALVYGLCLRMLKNKQDSLDAVSAIFEQIMDKAADHQVRHTRSWIYSLSKNHCLAILRKQQRRRRLFEDFARDETITNDDEYTGSEDVRLVKQAMGNLPGEQATCIRLFYFDGYSYAEISTITGWPLDKVKSHMQNGRRMLKRKLALKS